MAERLMKLKIVVPGVILLVVGVLLLAFPGVGGQVESGLGFTSSPAPSLYLVKVAPGNYSDITYTLQPTDQLSVTISAGPQPVDFFLMNGGNFSTWAKNATASSQVYPQSAFNVKNYTFNFPGQGRTQTYYLVFASRSTTSSTDVLIQSSIQDSSGSLTTTVPEAFLGVGVVLALVGAKIGGGKVEEQPKTPPAAAASRVQPALAPGTPTCKYCGARLDGSSKFCRSCGKYLG
jgi:hypothetical protein